MSARWTKKRVKSANWVVGAGIGKYPFFVFDPVSGKVASLCSTKVQAEAIILELKSFGRTEHGLWAEEGAQMRIEKKFIVRWSIIWTVAMAWAFFVPQEAYGRAAVHDGLWRALGWLVALGCLGALLRVLVGWLEARQAAEECRKSAQASAKMARARATTAYLRQGRAPETRQRFSDLSNSISANPDDDGLSEAQYTIIVALWNEFYASLKPRSEFMASLPREEAKSPKAVDYMARPK